MIRIDVRSLLVASALALGALSPAVASVPKVVFMEDFGATW